MNIEFNNNEIQASLALYDLALKSDRGGLQVAEAAVHLTQKFKAALEAEQQMAAMKQQHKDKVVTIPEDDLA